jgi:hypothetical protein
MVAENTVKKPAANPVSSTRKPAHNGHSISLEARRKIARSRITRGCDILPDVDGRSLVARRYREIASAILVDQGGEDQCSESRKQLIRRFAASALLAELMEADLANGKKISISEHALLVSSLVRVARQIGVARIPKNIVPTLGSILRSGIDQQRSEVPE